MVTNDDVLRFIDFCKDNIDFTTGQLPNRYNSLPVCILDCVYSLRTKYFPTCVSVVNRFAEKFLGGDKYTKNYSINNFIDDYDAVGEETLRVEILKNNQILAKRHKTEICYELAKKFASLDIQMFGDFAKFDYKILDETIRSVKGLGDAAVNYLFMLAGDQNRCKPDVHIHHCIVDALGHDISNEDCQVIFTEAVAKLKKDYNNLTVARLDNVIWNHYSGHR